MKRGRTAPSMFGGGSDSDEDSEEGHPVRRQRIDWTLDNSSDGEGRSKDEPTPKDQRNVEEDSLEAFMSSLNDAQSRGPPGRSSRLPEGDASESSEDGPVFKRKTREEAHSAELLPEDIERNAEGPARDLVLEPIDHTNRTYPDITSCGYAPLPRLSSLSASEKMLRLLNISASITNGDALLPIEKFQDLELVLPKPLLGTVLTSFEIPTPIQKVAIPAALEGRNVIGVAKTGSGKTAAYGIPLLCHVSAQPRGSSTSGRGPRALVIAPTRELALQISDVLKKLGEGTKNGVMCVVGGHAKYEQFKRLRDSGAQVVVCTPGRFIDMIKMKACGLSRCSFVVLDEADRMFDMGFGGQVNALLSQIRPDAQKLLFSATFPKSVASLVKSYVSHPVRITIGQKRENDARKAAAENGEPFGGSPKKMAITLTPMVSENVREQYVVVESEKEKESWLLRNIGDLTREGLVIVFCPTRAGAAYLANVIRTTGKPAACIHGETDAGDREGLLRMFRSGELPLLVTTDLTARGLDIANIRNVVNYGCAKSWDWHVHRVGRTGRASRIGRAFTIISKRTKGDLTFVSEAISAFRKSGRGVPESLLALAASERIERFETKSRGRGFRGRRRFGAGRGGYGQRRREGPAGPG